MKRVYSEEDDARIRAMAAAGHTKREIIAAFPGRSDSSVYERMRKLRVEPRQDVDPHVERRERMLPRMRELAAADKSASEAARIMTVEFGEPVTKAMLMGWSHRHDIRFKSQRKRQIALARSSKAHRSRKSNEMKARRAIDAGPPKEAQPWTPDADFSPNEHADRFTRLLNGAAVPNKSNRVYLPDLPGHKQCRHITGDIREPGAFWCGEPVSEGSSYCPCHRVICTALSRPRDRRWAREILAYADR